MKSCDTEKLESSSWQHKTSLVKSTVRIQVRVVVPMFQLWDHPSSLLASMSGNVLLPSSACDHRSFQGGVCCNCSSFSISALLSQVAYKNLQHSHIVHVQDSLENTTLLWFLTKQPLVVRIVLWLLQQAGRARGSTCEQWLHTCIHLCFLCPLTASW